MNITQDKKILEILQDRGKIDGYEALEEVGCWRLPAVVGRLKKQGHNIITKRVTKTGKFGKKSFAEYHLIKSNN